jgi:hypothetical protein
MKKIVNKIIGKFKKIQTETENKSIKQCKIKFAEENDIIGFFPQNSSTCFKRPYSLIKSINPIISFSSANLILHCFIDLFSVSVCIFLNFPIIFSLKCLYINKKGLNTSSNFSNYMVYIGDWVVFEESEEGVNIKIIYGNISRRF